MEYNEKLITMKNTTEKTLAQKALDILSDVPHDKFIIDSYTDRIDRCCAIGHLSRLTSENTADYSFQNCYDEIGSFAYSVRESSNNFLEHQDISNVNNNQYVSPYIEPVAKDRVVHLLTDMVKSGY